MENLRDEQDYKAQQFRAFLTVLTALFGIAFTLNLARYLLNSFGTFDLVLLRLFVLVTLTSGAWWLVRRQQISAASLLCSSLLVLIGVSTVPVYDYPFPPALIALLLAPTISLLHVSSRTFGWLCLAVWVLGIGTTAYNTRLFINLAVTPELTIANAFGSFILTSALLFLMWQFSRMHHLLTSSLRRRNAELGDLQSDLEQQVASRTAELEQTLTSLQARTTEQQRLLDQLQQQQALIQQLSVPVLPISAATLVLPLVGSLDPARLDLIRERALDILEQQHARTLVLDLTGVPEVDTQAAQGLLDVARATYLMGSTCVLAGMRPELAQTLVTLGVDLRSLRTFATLQRALDVVG